MMTTIVRRSCGAAVAAALALGTTVPAVAADTGGKQLTKQQWIKAADRICSKTDDKIDALSPPSGDPTQGDLTAAEYEELEDYAQSAYDYSKDALADLKALKQPKKDAAKVKKILTALKKSVTAIGELASAAGDGDRAAAVAAFEDSERHGDDFGTAAQAYGSTCGASDA